jgi:5-(carboxyamino)imidazole ribonucleotide synthase
MVVLPTADPSGVMPSASAPIGVVGGGQLAWMLAQAARELDLPLHVQTPSASDPAVRLAAALVQAPVDDVAATRELASACRAITFENEWVDLQALAPLAAEGVQFLPSLSALEPLVCKRSQRELLQRLQLPAPPWLPLTELLVPPAPPVDGLVGSVDDGSGEPAAAPWHGGAWPEAMDDPAALELREGWQFPLMAKAATGGYDGKGTQVLRSRADLDALLMRVDPANWIVEAFVRFDCELAQLVCRDGSGVVLCYPLVQTHQHQQVCDWVLTPAEVPHAVQAFARNIAASLLTAIDYVGVLSIEFFYGPDGLQVNEIAPRTHNSGHVTIEAARTSQFAQQARIVAGLPMGSADLVVPGALMVNLLGFEASQRSYEAERQALAALPGATVHWYGKHGSSPGRKLGHVTLLLQEPDPIARRAEAMARLEQVRQLWPLPPA